MGSVLSGRRYLQANFVLAVSNSLPLEQFRMLQLILLTMQGPTPSGHQLCSQGLHKAPTSAFHGRS